MGRWYAVSVLVKWDVEGNGELRLWVDGKKVLEKTGVDTIMDDGRVYRFESCGIGRCLGV
jgi:tRNA-dihydrouridine synthase